VTLDVSDSSEIYLFDDINVVPPDRVELYKNPTKTAEVTVIIENPDNSDIPF
jgi:iron transport multicopper oxidase